MDQQIASFWRSDRPDAPCLMVKGEIDMQVADDFRDALADVVLDAETPAVVDLTGVTLFSSSGIAALIDSKVLAEDRGVCLFVEPSGVVRRVLEIVRLEDEFVLSRPA